MRVYLNCLQLKLLRLLAFLKLKEKCEHKLLLLTLSQFVKKKTIISSSCDWFLLHRGIKFHFRTLDLEKKFHFPHFAVMSKHDMFKFNFKQSGVGVNLTINLKLMRLMKAWLNAPNISTQLLTTLLQDVATCVERAGQTLTIFSTFSTQQLDVYVPYSAGTQQAQLARMLH